MINEKGLGIDSNQLIQRCFAIVNDRDTYFNDLIRKFREKFTGLKLIYANGTIGARLNPEHPTPDFILVCKGTLVSNNPSLPNRHIILIDAPMIFTERSIAGWTIAVEQGNMNGYFDYMLDKALRLDQSKFYEYIEIMCQLSTDPKSPLYWKRPENGPKLVREMEELYARYNKNIPTRLQDKRGYKAN